MAAIVVSSVLSIAVLLLISGITKVLAPDPARNLFVLLPLPEILRASWVRRYLPWAEIVIAVALVIGSGVVLWAATAGSLVVFAVFTVFVTGAVTRGVPVPCGCFGRWSRAPVSWRTVVRNVVFTAVALLAFVVVSAGGYDGPVVRLPWWGLVAVAIPVLVLGVLVWSERAGSGPERFGITRGSRSTTPAAADPPAAESPADTASRSAAGPHGGVDTPPTAAGSQAAITPSGAEARTGSTSRPAATGVLPAAAAAAEPATARVRAGSSTAVPRDGAGGDGGFHRSSIPSASALDADGRAVSLRDLARQRARCLVGLNPSMGSDARVLEWLERGPDRIGPVTLHVVVSSPADLVAMAPQLQAGALIDANTTLARSFGVSTTPWATVLGTDDLLAGGPATGPDAVFALLNALEERFEG